MSQEAVTTGNVAPSLAENRFGRLPRLALKGYTVKFITSTTKVIRVTLEWGDLSAGIRLSHEEFEKEGVIEDVLGFLEEEIKHKRK